MRDIAATARRRLTRGRRSPSSSPPVNVTPPVLAGTVEIGVSLTVTPGTWSGTAPIAYTYTMRRDGTPITGLVGVSQATIEAYVLVASDIGPDLDVVEEATNSVGSDTAASNAVVFDHAAYLPQTAIGVSTAGIELVSGEVDEWESTLGGLSVVLTAPSAGARPAYAPTGGVGGRPLVTGNGSSDLLSGTATKGSAWSSGELGAVGRCLTAISTRWMRWSSQTLLLTTTATNNFRARWSNGTVTASAQPLTSTGHYSLDGLSGGGQDLRLNGTSVATGSGGAASESDGSAVVLFGDAAGAFCNFESQAWYIGPQLTADQRTHLRALLTYHTGIAS